MKRSARFNDMGKSWAYIEKVFDITAVIGSVMHELFLNRSDSIGQTD